MRAELSKGKETVRFEWNECGYGLVKVKRFDFARDDAGIDSALQDMQYAREYWDQLVSSGFKRADSAWDPALIALVDGKH